MKKTCKLLLAALLLAAVSCEKPYEKHYGLEISSPEYAIPIAGKTFPLYVYCDGSWSASFLGE